MKKVLILVLAAVVLLPLSSGLGLAAAGGISPTPAFSDIAGHQAEAALTVLGSLRVFTGAYGLGGAVKPDDQITREQYCKVIIVAMGRENVANGLSGLKPQFNDADTISRWAWGYVNAAVQAGIISGYPDQTFRAANPVKYSEAIKMLVCAIVGHKAQVDPTLPWPNNYIFYGVSHNFTGDVIILDADAYCTRGDMARMLFATMLVEPLKADGTPITDGAILDDTGVNARLFVGTLTGQSGGTLSLSTWMGPLPLGEPVYLIGAASYAECLGSPVRCVANTDHKIVYLERTAGTSNAGYFKERSSDADGTYILLRNGQKYYYTAPVGVTLNKEVGFNEASLAADDYLLVNTDASGKATAIQATRYDLVRIMVLVPHIPPPPPLVVAFFVHPEDCITEVLPGSGTTPTRITFAATSPFKYGDVSGGPVLWTPLADQTLEVNSSAVVKINGVPTTATALLAGDVVKVATYGAKGYADEDSIIEVCATRSVADGIVDHNTSETDATGTRYYAWMNIGGIIHKLQRDAGSVMFDPAYLTAELAPGQHYKLAKNEDGQLFYNLGFTTLNPIVFVKSAVMTGGVPPTYSIIVDNLGVEQEIGCTVNPVAWILQFGLLVLDGATGRATGFAPYPLAPGYTVASDMANSVTLQHTVIPGAWFGPAPPLVVYRKTGIDQYTYIGTSGLTVGWTVKAYLDALNKPLVVVYEP